MLRTKYLSWKGSLISVSSFALMKRSKETSPDQGEVPTDDDCVTVKSKKRKRKRSKVDASGDTPHDTKSQSPKKKGDLATPCTVSIALPGSIVDNAQSVELKTYLAGQIARAAVVFRVDEIVVFDEQGGTRKAPPIKHLSDGNTFLARLLQYLETPQYLRKQLFPMHPDLKLVGLLNPLDCPHHMRQDDHTPFREGVVLDRPVKQGAKGTKGTKGGSYVDCGMRKNVQIDKLLQPGVRVTVRLEESAKQNSKHHRGEAVSPLTPRQEQGVYWGYTVRLAHSLGAVFTECPFADGYDLTVGTSERGDSVDSLTSLPTYRHLLIVFGGVKGLEYCLECDPALEEGEVSALFHHYLNTCPDQGSRTIRTEEAVLITLSALRPLIGR